MSHQNALAYDDDNTVPFFKAGRYAALDIGTVTCRMLIADVDETGTLTELDRQYRITNLGEAVDATSMLTAEAIERVVAAIKDYLEVLEQFQPADGSGIKLTAIATSASRDAKNSSEFQHRLEELGVTLSVIPGEKEAALSFRGVASDFANESLLVVDIGGGSTEVIAGMGGGNPFRSHSFNIGCRRLTEKLFLADPPLDAEKKQARQLVEEQMAPYFDEIKRTGFVVDRMVAVAGTATTVVSVRDAQETYCISRVHGSWVAEKDLWDVARRFENVSTRQRAEIVGLDPGRAPVIIAGMIILETVLALSGLSGFTVSEHDILHGIISESASIGN